MKVYQVYSRNNFNKYNVFVDSEHTTIDAAIDELQNIALKNDSNITGEALAELAETRHTSTYHHTYYIEEGYSYDYTLATLKRIKTEYPTLFECYSAVDSGEAAELDIPYYYHSDTGVFELTGGNTLLDKSNVATMKALLADQGIVAYEHTYLCNSVSLCLDINTVLELTDTQLQYIEDTLNALASYPCLDDEHYSKLQWEYAQEQWQESSLQERITMIDDANSGGWHEHVSILAARHDLMPDSVFYDLLGNSLLD